jgi:hypothetical protein
MVLRAAESVFSALSVSSVSDDTVLEEVNFAGLIIDKLYFVLTFKLDSFYLNFLGSPLSLRVRGHATYVTRSEQGCRGEEGSRQKKQRGLKKTRRGLNTI